MAVELARAYITLIPSFEGAQKSITDGLLGASDTGGRAAGRRFGSSFGAVLGGSFFGNILANVGTQFAAGIGRVIGDAVRTGIDYVSSSVEIASSLNESANALTVAFGNASTEIADLGETAAQRLGLSNLAFNELATRFSGFASGIVGEGGDVVGFIDELTTRGADFASVYNLEVAEALQLFQSGLAGETEPLRRFGLDLSAATVEAHAYASGIAAAGEPLTEAQKQQARYSALLEQTGQVQGDFTNTADSLANTQRRLSAEWENAQGRLGAALLPALTELANFANDELIPILNETIDDVGPLLADALRESAPAVKELVVGLAPLIPDMIKLATEALPPMIGLMKALTPIISAAAGSIGGILGAFNALSDFLSGDTSFEEYMAEMNSLGGLMIDFGKWLGGLMTDLRNAIAGFAGEIQRRVGAAVSFVTSIPGQIISAIGNLGGTLYSAGRDLIRGFIRGVQSLARNMINAVLGPVRDTIAQVRNLLGIASPSKVFELIGTQIADGLAVGVDEGEASVRAAIDGLVSVPSVAATRPRVAAAAPFEVVVGTKGGIDLLKYVDVQVVRRDELTAVDLVGGLA